MSQNFLAPFVAQFAHALSVLEDQRGGDIVSAADSAAEGLRALCMDEVEVATVRAAAMEIRRAARRDVRLGCGRALAIVQAREDRLTQPAVFGTVGRGAGREEPSMLLRRQYDEATGETLPSVWEHLPDAYHVR